MKILVFLLTITFAVNSSAEKEKKRAPANEMASGVIVQQIPDTWSRTYRMVDTINNIVCFEKDSSISCVKVDKAKAR